ncbi:hypothetical protein I6M74_08435 [Acinetobacter bereziniae]|uniref:hypothetical protein n=1 Tax=Acinetobacter bereziniae TaxID=106648 RepID=UPI001902AA50|nr:hypothetical protein [Acinetobacter bereziniae]MBJ8421927.1 hypothetical protein [Acinetobacter bereziniae]
MSKETTIKDINLVISSIKNSNLNKLFRDYQSTQNAPSTFFSKISIFYTNIDTFEFLLKDEGEFYSVEKLNTIFKTLLNLSHEIQKVSSILESHKYSESSDPYRLFSSCIKISNDILNYKNSDFDTKSLLNKNQVIKLINKINNINNNTFDKSIIEFSKEIKPKLMDDLSKNLIVYYNLLNKSSNLEKDINLTNIESYIKQLMLIIVGENQKIELLEINEQRKENLTIEDIHTLHNGYQQESDILKKQIFLFHIFIFILFGIIIIALLIKFIIVWICRPSSIYLYGNLSFIIFILSLSTLLGYLIKERKRIIILHDKYKLISLKIDSLPRYMRELTAQQRQEMYIKMSTVFFENNLELQNSKENYDTKTLDDLIKIINVFKSKS